MCNGTIKKFQIPVEKRAGDLEAKFNTKVRKFDSVRFFFFFFFFFVLLLYSARHKFLCESQGEGGGGGGGSKPILRENGFSKTLKMDDHADLQILLIRTGADLQIPPSIKQSEKFLDLGTRT